MSDAPTSATGFADHFSRDSAAYAQFRPRYPAALFDWLTGLAPAHHLVWDVATGSGQAATMLAPHFERVIASDASVAQLRARTRAARVHYLAEQGEISALAPRSADLVTVAQAYHWFDHPRFHREVGRVLVPGGVLAVWCYGVLHVEPEIEAAMERFYNGTVGPYWPRERAYVERGYRDFEIPIEEVAAPSIAIEVQFTLPQLLGYVRSWSAVGRYRAANGIDPVSPFADEVASLWGNPELPRRVVWPITIRAGRWVGQEA